MKRYISVSQYVLVFILTVRVVFAETLTPDKVVSINNDYARQLVGTIVNGATIINMTLEYQSKARTAVVRIQQTASKESLHFLLENWGRFRKMIFTSNDKACLQNEYWPNLLAMENVEQIFVFYNYRDNESEGRTLIYQCIAG